MRGSSVYRIVRGGVGGRKGDDFVWLDEEGELMGNDDEKGDCGEEDEGRWDGLLMSFLLMAKVVVTNWGDEGSELGEGESKPDLVGLLSNHVAGVVHLSRGFTNIREVIFWAGGRSKELLSLTSKSNSTASSWDSETVVTDGKVVTETTDQLLVLLVDGKEQDLNRVCLVTHIYIITSFHLNYPDQIFACRSSLNGAMYNKEVMYYLSFYVRSVERLADEPVLKDETKPVRIQLDNTLFYIVSIHLPGCPLQGRHCSAKCKAIVPNAVMNTSHTLNKLHVCMPRAVAEIPSLAYVYQNSRPYLGPRQGESQEMKSHIVATQLIKNLEKTSSNLVMYREKEKTKNRKSKELVWQADEQGCVEKKKVGLLLLRVKSQSNNHGEQDKHLKESKTHIDQRKICHHRFMEYAKSRLRYRILLNIKKFVSLLLE
ncbi:hypothetical protein VP01_2039g1 [Puccinia sorghi]|uniref:Uncharacterized protein n=1 Tax=Puccinia sorghi TaxID=27349 RepID=A0A0L6VB20_9BASI|nr:hypothetical protein VP01_2039g1 [Puccinia sorghi]